MTSRRSTQFTTASQQVTPTKKRKTQPQEQKCTKPTDFISNISEQKLYPPQYTLLLPVRSRLDNLFNSVLCAYASIEKLQINDKIYKNDTKTSKHYTTYSIINSPIRKHNTYENWSVKDIALFESGIAKYSKNFHMIHKELLPHKTVNECVEFYYNCFKQSLHYNNWKRGVQPIKTIKSIHNTNTQAGMNDTVKHENNVHHNNNTADNSTDSSNNTSRSNVDDNDTEVSQINQSINTSNSSVESDGSPSNSVTPT